MHIRYSELAGLLEKDCYRHLPLAEDFLDFYINKDKEQFEPIDKKDRVINEGEKKDYLDLIEYIVWKIDNQSDDKGE